MWAVVREFVATCPRCKGRFHCHWGDLRHQAWKLLCPFCGLRFDQEESPDIEE